MIKLCGNSVCNPLSIIFNDCLNEGKFPHEWKKANVVSVYKKGNKQCLKNYRPISLLPICSKIFERLIYNEMFTFFTENKLISPNQSGLRSRVSYVNQLPITHKIYKLFDEEFEVRGVFLNISKAFDKVWHEGLLFWKPFETFTRFTFLPKTTSSSKWSALILLREFHRVLS